MPEGHGCAFPAAVAGHYRAGRSAKGKKVLIAAHGNSLRALVKYLDNISEAEIVELNIPTGMPLVYELDDDLKPIRHYYLGDPDKVKAAMEAVAAQGKEEGLVLTSRAITKKERHDGLATDRASSSERDTTSTTSREELRSR